ncbi:MAG: VTT domain-containing protein [Sphingopyxis sp.]|uniref:TVP38/TMEM64 family protein n=1 Tax=Sphingopyxis sp. TaxID=1908224 RepID=UPI002ABA75E2|nr:VTT domain-containing protein [Sphingopyxis sp.]MDZ3832417.1 VTT domain-containing protein [Sphingopyxis sp.]
MKPLLKAMFTLAAIFASTFILGRALGILTEENVRSWLEAASNLSVTTAFLVVVMLLFIDLFVAVPTLTIVILAGYFLGFGTGFTAAMVGSASAAFGGYAICRRWGEAALAKVVRDPAQRQDMREAFAAHGPGMILLARAAPILPEVTACMSGVNRMALSRFCRYWTIGALPYMAIAAYAGSVSTIDDPMPAIYAALGLYALMWTGWFFYRRFRMASKPPIKF